ncbi:MAG: hypothetical protein AAF617_02275 [Bacteroidota bacterium]
MLNFGIRDQLQISLTDSLQKLTTYYFGISINTIDYLALASIPFFGMLYNSTRKTVFTKSKLVMDILTVLFCVIIILGIGLYALTYVGSPVNPLVPKYILMEPFELFSVILIGLGIALPYLITKLFRSTS